VSFTDLWRCKRCNELPEILFRGKNFLIKCKTCNSKRAEVFANSLDEVVARWNKKNDPIHPGFMRWLLAWPSRLKDFVEYQCTRRSFTPAPPPADEAPAESEPNKADEPAANGDATKPDTTNAP
jgi:hypothetical protein